MPLSKTVSFDHEVVCLLFALLLGTAATANAQITIEGIEIGGPEDSLAARRVLEEVPPTSSFWTERHIPGYSRASGAFSQVIRAAYPSLNLADPDTAVVERVLHYMERVATEHPNKGVRAEFLLSALSMAHALGMKKRTVRYYQRMMQEHGESYYAAKAEEYAPSRAIQKGKSVPSFSLTSLASAEHTFTDESLRGKTYLIDFWGTWCGPCIAEIPYLQNAYEKYKTEGLTILSVALDDSAKAVRFFRKKKWPMPWKHAVVENNSQQEIEIRRKFEIYGLPEAILVNTEGKIIAEEGALRGERLDKTLSRVLGENE